MTTRPMNEMRMTMDDLQLTDEEWQQLEAIHAIFVPAERMFLEFVRANKQIGYGRMMQIISHEWYRAYEGDRAVQLGVFDGGRCVGMLPKEDRELYELTCRSDPVFEADSE